MYISPIIKLNKDEVRDGMRRIILIKEYASLISAFVLAIIGLFLNYTIIYNSISFISNRTTQLNFLMYCIVILSYIFIIISTMLHKARVLRMEIDTIKTRNLISKLIILTSIIIIHTLYWTKEVDNFYVLKIYYFIRIWLIISIGLFKLIIDKGIYINSNIFIVGNREFEIKKIKRIKDDFGSNFNVYMDNNTYSIFCGSLKGKIELLNRLDKKLSRYDDYRKVIYNEW